jgi:hypothetical protein
MTTFRTNSSLRSRPTPAPGPAREAFILEPHLVSPAWPQAVADYLATFEAGEPVALVLAPGPGTPVQALAEQGGSAP